jgi:hypothetical protein
MSVRAANTMAALGAQPYLQVTNNVVFAGIQGRFVQVRAGLIGPGFVTPAVSDVTVTGICDPVSQNCCITGNDCNDGDTCTADLCPFPGGACQHAPIFDCCAGNADCNDADQCTIDVCNVALSQCTHNLQPNCCNANSDCDDAIFCTVDLCSGSGGTCSHQAISGCCQSNAECDDGNACSDDICPANNLCQHMPKAGCCTTDGECKENPDDLCTINTCEIVTGKCGLVDLKPSGCCNVDADCADGNSCTTDKCTGPGGTCQHNENPGCCTPNDPKVGQPCDLPKSPYDKPPCKPGALVCTNGQFDCVGAVKPGLEVCDGKDNDCNGVGDTPTSCPNPDDVCVWGQCSAPCDPGEFPCDNGFQCYDDHCVPISCDKTVCPDGLTCVNGLCVENGASGGAAGSNAGGSGGGNPAGGSGGGSAGTNAGGANPNGGNSTTGSGTGARDNPFGLATGGGGCRCSMPGEGERDAAGLTTALAALALVLGRKRRRGAPEDRA